MPVTAHFVTCTSSCGKRKEGKKSAKKETSCAVPVCMASMSCACLIYRGPFSSHRKQHWPSSPLNAQFYVHFLLSRIVDPWPRSCAFHGSARNRWKERISLERTRPCERYQPYVVNRLDNDQEPRQIMKKISYREKERRRQY